MGHGSDMKAFPRGEEDVQVARMLRAILLTALALIILWLAGRSLLLIFAGVLFGIMLNALSRLSGRLIGLSRTAALFGVTGVVALACAGTAYFLLPRAIAQGSKLADRLSASFDHLSQSVAQYFPQLHMSIGKFIGATSLPVRMFGFTSSLSAALVAVAIIIFIGLYSAFGAPFYRKGLVRLFPRRHRQTIDEILALTGTTLEWWLLGRAITMTAVGFLTLAGLLLLNIPLAAPLALIAGLLTFVPFLGAIISAIPAVLIAFVQGPLSALYVALVFTAAHAMEAYVVAPLVQKRAVHLPPVVMLGFQVILGTLYGTAGLTFAAPLAAVGVVLVRKLYLDIEEEGSLQNSAMSAGPSHRTSTG